jgi:heme exporter protein D
MTEFFAMHGYGGYVWSAYGVFFVALVADAIMPLLRRRRALSGLRSRLKREAARSTRQPASHEPNA